VLDKCSPAAASAVDPAPAQIDYFRTQPIAQQADFRVADAQALPFPDSSFDVIVSALVLNFIPDRLRALTEMRRVGRAGGIIAAYVWDFAAGRSPQWPFAVGMSELGIEPPVIAGRADSTLDALLSLFLGAGLESVETRPIDVSVIFSGFDEVWQTQIPSFNPYRHIIDALSEVARSKLTSTVKALLPIASDGSITYSARANAVKARVPR
jgi:SAM-dependent methyltransferase